MTRVFVCVQHCQSHSLFPLNIRSMAGQVSFWESWLSAVHRKNAFLKQAHGEPVLPSQRLAMLLPLLVILQLQNSPFLKSRHPKRKIVIPGVWSDLKFCGWSVRVGRALHGHSPTTDLSKRRTCWSRRTSPDQSLRQSQTLADSRRSHRSSRQRWAAEWGRWNSTELQWAGWMVSLRCWAVGENKSYKPHADLGHL